MEKNYFLLCEINRIFSIIFKVFSNYYETIIKHRFWRFGKFQKSHILPLETLQIEHQKKYFRA